MSSCHLLLIYYRYYRAVALSRIAAARTARLLVLAALYLGSAPAQAHVKWFADWSVVICPPRDPMRVLSMPLWQAFFVAAIVVMALLGWLDARLAGSARRWQQRLDRVHEAVMPHAMRVLRLGLCLYWLMVSLTLSTPVYLTPELSAPAGVRWLQMACAVVVLRRSSSWLAGLGMVALYVMAAVQHGWFHLLDYPLFLGLGIILLLPALRRREDDALALDLLRWSAAITLLWGGVEKFAFPEWSFDMMQAMPVLSLGVSPEAAMYMYGFGEMALSFALLLFGIGSQIAAFLLLLVFVLAVPPFGWVDFVGHSGIVVALVLLSLTKPRTPVLRATALHNGLLHGGAFPAAVMGLWGLYVGLHAVYLQSLRPDPWVETQARAERAMVRMAQSGRQAMGQIATSSAEAPPPGLNQGSN
jgi:hypothetical protein